MIPYNEWFATNIIETIDPTLQNRIIAWIYGHTHIESVKRVQNVNTYCNPVGYVGERNDIDWQKNFEII